MRKISRSRGASVLAALVFVAILGGIAYTVEVISPGESISQTASAAPQSMIQSSSNGGDPKKVVKSECLPGHMYTIQIDRTKKGQFSSTLQNGEVDCFADPKNPGTQLDSVTSKIPGCEQLRNKYECQVMACAFGELTNNQKAKCFVAGKCDTRLAPKKCTEMMSKVNSGTKGTLDVIREGRGLKEFNRIIRQDLNPGEGKAIRDAFATPLTELEKNIEEDLSDLVKERLTTEEAIKRFEVLCTEAPPTSSDDPCTKAQQLKVSKATLDAQQKAFENQLKDLGEAKKLEPKDGCAPGYSFYNGMCVDCSRGACQTPPPYDPRTGQDPRGRDEGVDCAVINGVKYCNSTSKQTFPGGLGGGGGAGRGAPAGNGIPSRAGTCAPQNLCSNGTLYARANTCVDTPLQACQYGCLNTTACATSPTQCPNQPVQPDSSSCQAGAWKPVTTTAQNGASCVSSWQCISGATQPTAQISCQPQVADVGMSISISYTCGNSATSVGSGFSTGGALSGSVNATVSSSTLGASGNIANFGLTCSALGVTQSAQCSIQVAKPSIVLVVNPKVVKAGEGASIGWVTSGMKTCTISSPDIQEFTTRNAGNTSVNGMATISPTQANTGIVLKCQTVGGNAKEASAAVTLSQ